MGTIINGIINFFNNASNTIAQVRNGINAIFELIGTTLEFIPQPFLTITLIFLPIMIASITLKAIFK